MKDYVKAYNAYAQDPKTTHRMHDYYAPDFEIIHYFMGANKISGRDKFLHLMSSHPSSYETLTPEDIVVDERRKVSAMLLKTEVVDKKLGKVVVVERYLVHYQLVLDENSTIKIKKILFFREVLPPGALDTSDVFKKDPEMTALFS